MGQTGYSFRRLLSYSGSELAVVDPVEMNLLVARDIAGLESLDIQKYRTKVDVWAGQLKRGLREVEPQFHQNSHHWKNDLAFFRLGYLSYFVDEKLGIRYREDQRNIKSVLYADASDLFLHGVMDTRKGTCGNMALLHVALGWRLRWPISLACAGPHLICRYDDGKVTHNIEATKTGVGGFQSHPDEYYVRCYNLSKRAIECGSDLRALAPREMLGVFVGFRARLYENTSREGLAEQDYLLARYLFPNNRQLHFAQTQNSIQYGASLFEPGEVGHPIEVHSWLGDVVGAGGPHHPLLSQERFHGTPISRSFKYDESGKIG